MFVTFITISFFFSNRCSNLTTIEILVLLSWIPASKEFCKQRADKNINKSSITMIILAIQIGGQKCLVYESYLFNISKMDLGHPVINSLNNHSLCGKIQAKILTPNSDYPTHLVWYFFNFQSSHVILTSFWTSMAWTHHSPMSITQH